TTIPSISGQITPSISCHFGAPVTKNNRNQGIDILLKFRSKKSDIIPYKIKPETDFFIKRLC
ncbi:hypothetical protein, partial [Weizmannia sp. CD-2023]|uniref:hypothetical protein n=1 Tax=Weizmannia sp. CD-2023 TaxID=3037263 RepID=UPI002E20BB63|nr:hypothetical protein [Weizmannia sp. CD-2023]